MLRRLALLTLLMAGGALRAQSPALRRADSLLVGRILHAELVRDARDPALAQGASHADARIRTLAKRAQWRIGDSLFVMRDSLPALAPAPVWPEPAWRLRYRALAQHRSDCAALEAALADSAWQVRLRAADLVPATCASDSTIASTLRGWVASLPVDASRRAKNGVSWHPAAHAIVALARVWPSDARARIASLATHAQWQPRMYAARAAALLADTTSLRTLVRDRNDDVREAAIESLARLTHHADDALFIEALHAKGAQVVRVAALALAGSPLPTLKPTVDTVYRAWVARDVASARDVRLALLAAAGRSAAEDQPPARDTTLPNMAVPLALGADLRLRVEMAEESGGGSFVVRLRGDAAPIMVARILGLVRAHYYDGLTWHRVEPDFVIQGGSPGASEYVGLNRFLRDELATIPHPRGTVGMSTRGHDTGDAQWFVNLRDNPRLVRDYTVFGEVVDGIDVVDGVLEGDRIKSITVVR